MTVNWYVRRGEQQWGPYPAQTMMEYVATGNIDPRDLVWRDGMSGWQVAGSLSELFPKQTPVAKPNARNFDRIAYIRGGERFRRPRYCVGCMARDPSRRTTVTGEQTVVGSGGSDVLGGMVRGFAAAGLVGGVIGGVIGASSERPIEVETLTFEFPICPSCLRHEEATFFSQADRPVECRLYGDDIVFIFTNLEYAEEFREENRLGPPPRGFVSPIEEAPEAPVLHPRKVAPTPPEDSPFAGLGE